MHVLQLFALSLLCGALLVACWTDLRARWIPDSASIAVILGFVLYHAAAGKTALLSPTVAWHVAVGVTVFTLSALAFARGWIGGGDVKLLSAVSLWAGPGQVLPFLFATSLASGGIALLLIGYYGVARAMQPADDTGSLPFAIAIAVGGLHLLRVMAPNVEGLTL